MQSILDDLSVHEIDTLAKHNTGGMLYIPLHTKNETKATEHVLKYMYPVQWYGSLRYYTHYSEYIHGGYGARCTIYQATNKCFYLRVEAYEEF